jgi:NitT/TauT family transport system permease protein
MSEEKPPLLRRIWGGANALIDRSRRTSWIDLLILSGLVGLLFGVIGLAHQWSAQRLPEIEIDTSPWALPRYTFFSLARGLIAYAFSLLFTLVYGYWAAKDQVAQRVLIPLLDILQSIPVLGFMPGLILVFVALFPNSNAGLELAAVVSIFTGQAWNMTFSFYQSVRSVPRDMHEAATVYRFSWWQQFRWVELPYSGMGLVWNSMMSMAGGWFFLATIEGLEIGGKKYWSPGIGSYIKQASSGDQWDWAALLYGVLAMVLMIVALDQLLWRPVVAWAKKFRVEEGGSQEEATSWFLDWLRRSRLVGAVQEWLSHLPRLHWTFPRRLRTEEAPPDPTQHAAWGLWLSRLLFISLLAVLAYGAFLLVELLIQVNPEQWLSLTVAALWTLVRVLASLVIGTLWALPAGLAIGLSPRLSRVLQPVVQVLASFPAPLLFPLVVAGLVATGVTLDWGSILLMLLGTQWYILFNVIAGTMAIPADLKEAARSYRISGWQRFRVLYFPALFPYLVTGWVTAAGGAWNASIVAEFIDFTKPPLEANGLGARIMVAAGGENYATLAASVLVMSTVVVLFNRTVWRYCYRLADRRFSVQR